MKIINTIEEVIDKLQEHHGAVITKGYIHYAVELNNYNASLVEYLELTESELIDLYESLNADLANQQKRDELNATLDAVKEQNNQARLEDVIEASTGVYKPNNKNQNMTQLETLKQDLAELEVRIHNAMASDGNSITLTRDQLKEFANAVQTYSFDKIKNDIEDLSIDIEDHVSLELNRLELEILVATDDVLSDITSSLSDPNEITDNDVRSLLEGIKIYGSL